MLAVLVALSLSQTAPPPQGLRWDPRVDIPVTGALVTGWLLSELAFKKDLGPPTCRWCETNGFDVAVRGLFVPSMQPSASGISGPDVASNVIGFGVLPVALIGLDALFTWRDGGRVDTFLVDVLLILEATFVSLSVNQVVKFAVGRGRPYTVGASPELLASGRDPPDNNLSFFSGHANYAFVLVSSAATVATLRGYRLAWLMWLVGLPLATATSVLRIAGDKHWATDVLVGSAFGVAVGILLPKFLHGRVGPVSARLSPMPNGLGISGQF